ncbi:hypothetical protein Taro_015365 [Colocasia esculenta]|uniref:Glycosyltransferase n=1 Tax=Colocasia esculenta TaxID=4460 RepID=A0A843UHB1_COLES|nr:hypothetical protein [Colocasia esculenta]
MVSGGQQQEEAHVAVLAFPFGTHAAPLHALARGLAAAAPLVWFSFFNSAKSNASLLQGGDAPPNLKFYDVSDGLTAGFAVNPRNPEEEIELFMQVTPGNFRDGIEKAVRSASGASISCVVSDAFLWFAGDLAREMGAGVPWVPLWTGGIRSLSAHIYTDALRTIVGVGEEGGAVMATKADTELGFLPGMSGTRVRDLPEGIVFGNLSSVFARLLHRMGQELPLATAVVLNTFDVLDPAINDDLRAKFKACHLVGPLNLLLPPPQHPELDSDPSGCLRWLDKLPRGAVAYVSFGTVMSPPPGELAELAEGLESCGAPFLWSLKEKLRARLPAGFLERTQARGLVVAWAPQPLVLAHPATGAFMTHCGWNSVMESLAGGVPMVCRPFLGDQRLNARTVASLWRVGVEFEAGKMTRDGVVGALGAVLGSEEGRKMRERACALGEAAREAVQQGGSSAEALQAVVKVICGSGDA